MIFLIVYDGALGEVETFEKFQDADTALADKARLEIEIDLLEKGIDREVVLLEAENEEALRKTHRRYFETLRQLMKKGLPAP